MNNATVSQANKIPDSWIWVTVGDVADTISTTYSKIKQRQYLAEGILPVVDQGQVKIGGYTNDLEYKVDCELPVIAFGDHTRTIKFIDFEFAAGADGLKVLKPIDAFAPKLFFYFLHAIELPDKGYSRHFQYLRASKLPLPPLAEQRRIVDAIETHFTRLDAAVASLRSAQARLHRYRTSLLKAACEGRLVPTEAELARAEERPFEDGATLLGRILAERRRQWEADNRPDQPKNDKWKDKYNEPAAPDMSSLPDLPDGWSWATVEQINPGDRTCAYGVLQPGPDVKDGVLLVRVGDIDDKGNVHLDDMKRIAPDIAAGYSRTRLQGGEVLISLVGAIGRTAVVPASLAGSNTARAVGVIPLNASIKANWVELWFRNPVKMHEMIGKSHEVARKTLNLEDVRSATIALPPLAEQERIVEEVERRLYLIEQQEAFITASLKRAERLRQSILKRAFAGQL